MQCCAMCRTELPDYAHFCRHCGHALGAAGTAIDEVTRLSLLEKTQPLPSRGSRISEFPQKGAGTLPTPVQRAVATLLTRARDPKPGEACTGTREATQSLAVAWGWLPILAVVSALGLLSVSYAYNSARYGATGADIYFWLGVLLIFVPSALRLISPAAFRFERIGLLCVVGIYFYLINVVEKPFPYLNYDALVHMRTANDIAASGHLFSENSLLTVSPFYPGLEIATNALSKLSGLSAVDAGVIVVGMGYLVLILSLFLLYEQVTKSARIAGIATIIYMTNPHFLFFDTGFSYESLALPLAALVLFATAHHETLGDRRCFMVVAAWIVLGALVVTHHLTSFVLDGLFMLWAIAYGFEHGSRVFRSNVAKTALLGTCMALAWIGLKGNPVVGYLSSYFGSAVDELGHILNGTSSARHLFVSYSGQSTPLWERIMATTSVALIMLCLPLGLLCFWHRYRSNALIWAFAIASLFYPVSQIFRFTNFGSEITDRFAAFVFIPIGCLLAIFIVQFWPTRWLNWKQISLITGAVSVLFLGGVVLGIGPPFELLPGPYMVAADQRSVEPEGIQAAIWAASYLGPNNRVATDRSNQLLMSAYGDQRIVTSSTDQIEVAPVFTSSSFGPNEVSILRRARVRYLVVDLRLSTALPSFGFYFEQGEPGSFKYVAPIKLRALTKFNAIAGIDRVFDSGDIVIDNVEGLTNAP